MSLNYKWSLDQIKKGKTLEEVEQLAQDYEKEESKKELLRFLLGCVHKSPLWHSTDYLSDEDVRGVLNEFVERILTTKFHRHPSERDKDWYLVFFDGPQPIFEEY